MSCQTELCISLLDVYITDVLLWNCNILTIGMGSGKSEKTEETYPLCCLYSFYKRITMPLIIKFSTGLWGERGPEKTRDEVLADTLPLPGRVSASPF